MNIYTNYGAVPSRLLALASLLLKMGPLPREEARALLHPLPLRGGTQFNEIVEAATECGLVTAEGAMLALTEPIVKAVASTRDGLEKLMPAFMGRLVLCASVKGKDNRFARICAWVLMHPLDGVPGTHEKLKDQFKQDGFDRQSYYLNDNAAWDMVFYWMRYLGLISRLSSEGVQGIVPDPTRFLDWHLGEIFSSVGDGKPLEAQAFVANVARVCPVLDGGGVWCQVQAISPPSWGPDKLSPSLSLAMQRLSSSKRIKVGSTGDQRKFLLTADGKQFAWVTRI